MDVLMGAIELGVKYISATRSRPRTGGGTRTRCAFLMGFNRDVIHRRREELAERGVRIRWAGRRPRLWRSVIRELEDAEQLSDENTVLTLQFCCNYGGRAEIVDAAAAIAPRSRPGKSARIRSTSAFSPAISTSRIFRMWTCSCGRRASSGFRTSCSGSRPTPSLYSSTRSGPISTAGICGRPARSTPHATADTAAPGRTRCPASVPFRNQKVAVGIPGRIPFRDALGKPANPSCSGPIPHENAALHKRISRGRTQTGGLDASRDRGCCRGRAGTRGVTAIPAFAATAAKTTPEGCPCPTGPPRSWCRCRHRHR